MGQTKHGKVETTADKIRADLKAAGIPHKSVSVRQPHYCSVHVTIRDASISISRVREIASAHEHVRHCEYSGEILSGGNTFVDVEYSGEVLAALVQAIGWRLANAKPGEVVRVGDRQVFWRHDGNYGGYVSELDHYPTMHAHANVSVGKVHMWEDFRFPASQLAADLLDRAIPLDVPSDPVPEVAHADVSDPDAGGQVDDHTDPPPADPDPTETDLVPVAPPASDLAEAERDLEVASALFDAAADLAAIAGEVSDAETPGPVLSPSTCRPLPPFPERVNRYEEKQERRRERLERRAAKARAEAVAAFASANRIASGIPMGQPVLVGHHSERRHRKDLERIDRGMRKGIEAEDRAAHYTSAAASVGTGGISSDDPEAVIKLRAELAERTATRALEKKWNAQIRRAAAEHEKKTGKPCTQADHRAIVATLPDCPEPIRKGLASYAFAFPWLPQFGNNTAADIRRIEKRIAELTTRDETPEREPIVGPGYRIEENKLDNRVQIFFDTKPSEEIRKALKSRGFRWAPSVGAWQRHASNGAWYEAARALGRDPS